jgi:hypothetical protein
MVSPKFMEQEDVRLSACSTLYFVPYGSCAVGVGCWTDAVGGCMGAGGSWGSS